MKLLAEKYGVLLKPEKKQNEIATIAKPHLLNATKKIKTSRVK